MSGESSSVHGIIDGVEELEFARSLTEEEKSRIHCPAPVNRYRRQKLEQDAKKNWDLFYKRNGDRFFKRRYWTRREFEELSVRCKGSGSSARFLLEVGCGCGDFVLPLLEYDRTRSDDPSAEVASDLFIYCCDISDVAIDILTSNQAYKRNHPARIKAFVSNIVRTDASTLSDHLDGHLMDFVSLVFVLSALDPDHMVDALNNISSCLNSGGLVLFRDYAVYDAAMIRFKKDSKVGDQFYVRQDGTRAYFFQKRQLIEMFAKCHLVCESIDYIEREKLNHATRDKFSRIFLQAKFRKPNQ